MTFFAECAVQVAPDPERREGRHETRPGTVVTPDGGLVAAACTWFEAAACREVLAVWDERRTA